MIECSGVDTTKDLFSKHGSGLVCECFVPIVVREADYTCTWLWDFFSFEAVASFTL